MVSGISPLNLNIVGSTVGIGTTGPMYRLDVDYGSVDSIARFASSDDLANILVSDNDTTGYFNVKDSKLSLGLTSGLSNSNININSSGHLRYWNDSTDL